MFLIIFFGMILPLAGLAFCILWCRKNNPDKAFVFKRPFNMYVTSFLSKWFALDGLVARCRSSGDGGNSLSSSACNKPVVNVAAWGSGENKVVELRGGLVVGDGTAKKNKPRIEIMPGELVSCTNNKLVSSSKCLNLET